MPADAIAYDLDRVPDLATIDREVRKGLPGDAGRMQNARLNQDYYQCDNAKHVPRRADEDVLHWQNRPRRTSLLTRKAVRALGTPLYKPGPTRRVEASDRVNAWLQGVYQDVGANATMQAANLQAILNAVAAVQVEATGIPRRPLRLWLWRAYEFAVFCRDGDPRCPWAVVVRDVVPEGDDRVRARYRAWSAREYRTYKSDPFGKDESPIGKEAPHLVAAESGDTPYPGVLPFVFVRNEPPECDFWDGGIGGALRACNAEIDRELSDVAEHLQVFLNPKGFLRNVSVQSALGMLDRVGEFSHLKPATQAAEGDNSIPPDAFYLQAQLGVEQAWMNAKNYMDATIEELDIPLTAVRSDAATDLSGVAIFQKTLPLIDYTRVRQVAFTETEAELAGKALAVAGTHHLAGATDAASGAPAAELLAVAADPKFTAVWPEPQIPLPTAERDLADQWALDAGISDPIEVMAKRAGVTLEAAEELAVATIDRRKRWEQLTAGVQIGPEPIIDNPDPKPGDNPENDTSGDPDHGQQDAQD